jgi:hypothetical protein
MNAVWKEKLNRLLALLKEQLTETSTLRGVLVLLALGSGWAARIPTDAALAIAVVLGAVLKIVLPDKIG